MRGEGPACGPLAAPPLPPVQETGAVVDDSDDSDDDDSDDGETTARDAVKSSPGTLINTMDGCGERGPLEASSPLPPVQETGAVVDSDDDDDDDDNDDDGETTVRDAGP